MKHNCFIKTLFLLLLLFNSKVFAENKTVYLDLNYIMNESIVGKSLNTELSNLKSKKFLIFEEIEKGLNNDKETIDKQRNIIKKEEYIKKIDKLKNDIVKYNKEKKIFLDEINKKTINAKSLLFQKLEIIMSKYSKDNNISLIIQKKNILLGKSELDITKNILKKFNEKIKKIDLK